jgi:hypothetical protein
MPIFNAGSAKKGARDDANGILEIDNGKSDGKLMAAI